MWDVRLAQGQEHLMPFFFIMHATRNVIHSYTCVDVFWCLEQQIVLMLVSFPDQQAWESGYIDAAL